jgi:two-component system sensor histidine kinase ChvG
VARRGLSLRVRVVAVALAVVLAPLLVVGAAGLRERNLVAAARDDLEAAVAEEVALTSASAETQRDHVETIASDHAIWLRVIEPHGELRASSDHDRGGDWLHHLGTVVFGPDGAPTLAAFDARLGPLADRPEVLSASAAEPHSDCRTTLEGTLLVCHAVMKRADGAIVHASTSSRRTVRALYDLRSQMLRLTLGLVPFAVLVAWLLGRGIVKPIRALGAQARARARDPEAALRLDEVGDAEVRDLAVAFNELLARLQDRQSKNQTFTTDLVHELKSPLSTVRAAAETLESGNLDRPRAERLARALRDAGGRLDAVVTQFLELARAEAGLVGDERGPVDIAALTRRIAETTREKHPEVALELDLDPVELQVVPHALDAVVRNLIENAVSFAEPRGDAPARVSISLRRVEDRAELRVEDTGPGIAPEDLDRVFDRFFTSRGRDRGTGLGLALVKAIVEAHGGSVCASSEPGRGAIFTVRFVRANAP